jgi:NAD(P)-dependent dehydrogenase (short-subunit alcohol dehydrogenase family)
MARRFVTFMMQSAQRTLGGTQVVKTVVITGSTRGIGYGLADELLKLGCQVVVSGREQANVDRAVAELAARYDTERVWGLLCDVTHAGQVQALWDGARQRFGHVDIWINNAGASTPLKPVWEQDAEAMRGVVETNLVGALNGARAALRGMMAQGSGSLYNLEGFGSDGRIMAGMAPYGLTKYAMAYLTDALVKETKGTGIVVGALRPGMVMTRLITDQYEGKPEEWERAKGIFNVLADRVETVTPYLARQVLSNTRTGVRIRWLSGAQIALRFLTAPFHKRHVVD